MRNKKDNFKRLAEARTNMVIKYIRLLGNLTNTVSYEYTDEDWEKITKVINTELNGLKDRIKRKSKNDDKIFSLD